MENTASLSGQRDSLGRMKDLPQKGAGGSRTSIMIRKNITILLLLTGLIAFFSGGNSFAENILSIEDLRRIPTSSDTLIYADDGVLIGELKTEKGVYVPLDKMSQRLINAVVAVEDSRFWSHGGIDYLAIGRAFVKDLLHAELKEGGSTITQQLVKTVFLGPEKTFKRKMTEAALAKEIETKLSKKEILELYLNKVYFGHGAYGAEMASKTYFGKSVQQLNLAEAALIAGLLKAPVQYSPYNNVPQAKARQHIVLSRMEKEGYISRAEKELAFKQPLLLTGMRTTEANYFIEYIRKYLEATYGTEAVYKRGLSVYTTLDRAMQAAAVAAMHSGLKEIDKRRGWRGALEHGSKVKYEKDMKENQYAAEFIFNQGEIYRGQVLRVSGKEAIIKTRGLTGTLSIHDALWASRVPGLKNRTAIKQNEFSLTQILKPGDVVNVGIKSIRGRSVMLSLEQEPEVEGALVAVEPYTGFVRAMVGGYDFAKSDFNRVIHAKRQAGSAFKPLIYAAALDNGFTAASMIYDEPVTYTGGPNGRWSPENYDHIYYGPTRLREALTYSRNVVTVKLADSMGIDTLTNFTRTIGVQSDIPRNLSIALGSFDITPFELVMAYNVFASGGMKSKPISIKYIADRNGAVLEKTDPVPEQVISPQTSYLITSMMEDVVRYGTGWRAKALNRPVAGKTGTTNDNKDAWFVGYTPNLVAGVWVGFDKGKSLGVQETGAMAALPIWVSFMNNAVKGSPEEFFMPEGIVSYAIDQNTGLLSEAETGLREYFKEGTQPTQFSGAPSIWKKREPEQFNFD